MSGGGGNTNVQILRYEWQKWLKAYVHICKQICNFALKVLGEFSMTCYGHNVLVNLIKFKRLPVKSATENNLC